MYISSAAIRDFYVGAYRERADRDSASGELIMKPSKAQRRFVWIVLAATLTAPAIFISKLGIDPSSWPLPAALLCVALMLGSTAWLVSLRRRIYISTSGIVSRPPLGRETSIAWTDISSVRFREWGRKLCIYTKKRPTIVIPSTMSGAQDLEDMMDQHLQVQVYAMAFMKYRASLKHL